MTKIYICLNGLISDFWMSEERRAEMPIVIVKDKKGVIKVVKIENFLQVEGTELFYSDHSDVEILVMEAFMAGAKWAKKGGG